MLRKILANYEFVFMGKTFKAFDLYLGDTANPKVAKQKDYSCEVVCLALKITNEELARMLNTKYWDVNSAKLEAAGIHFNMLEIHFFPEK